MNKVLDSRDVKDFRFFDGTKGDVEIIVTKKGYFVILTIKGERFAVVLKRTEAFNSLDAVTKTYKEYLKENVNNE